MTIQGAMYIGSGKISENINWRLGYICGRWDILFIVETDFVLFLF